MSLPLREILCQWLIWFPVTVEYEYVLDERPHRPTLRLGTVE